MWLLSCFFTSGWIHSCSREPSTHTRGLVEETVGGPKDQRAGAPVLSSGRSHVGCTGSPGKLGSHARAARGSGWGGNPPQAREGLSPWHCLL